MKKARQKLLIEFEYQGGTIQGGIYNPPLKNAPWDKIYYRVQTKNFNHIFKMTADEASCIIACLGIALNHVLEVKKK